MACVKPGDIVIDVGGKHGQDGDVLFLDHHQRDGAGKRANGIPYAAAGLVWSDFGRELLQLSYPALGQQEAERVWAIIDRDFISPIDAADNGFKPSNKVGDTKPLTLSTVISWGNPPWYEQGDFDLEFQGAVEFATAAFRRALAHAYGTVLAESEVKAGLDSRTDPRVLVLERFCPWQETIFEINEKEVLFVVFRQSSGGRETWLCQCVPNALGSFGKRKPLPSGWGGLRDAGLQEFTGVSDAIFCHAGLFITGAGSKEGALRLAQLALDA
jgi:uncharacterized UPF0160 family protein